MPGHTPVTVITQGTPAMASAAEQLASNFSLGSFSKATELRKRILFTLGALMVYRLGTYIPVPGVDATVMAEKLTQHGGGILGMFNMFTGGALGRMTVFALNIMPYISASIIVQLMSTAIPSLETLKKEGESGRKKMNQYTRYLTVLIALSNPTAYRSAWNPCTAMAACRRLSIPACSSAPPASLRWWGAPCF
jgi:preprotein translocase subunit SecY